jgi:predicted metal-dependent enzyme (double-stranded beta helix superfamily)
MLRSESVSLRSESAKPRAGLGAPLARLVREIESACGQSPEAMRERIVAALAAAAAAPRLLTAEQRRPQACAYARHVLHSDPAGRFTILSLVWAPGQFSPPHAHHTWCGYAVRENTLTETLYAFDSAAMKALPLRTAARCAGYACFAQAGLEQIHRLGNAGSEPAISIHVYGVEGARVGTHVNRVIEVAQSGESP